MSIHPSHHRRLFRSAQLLFVVALTGGCVGSPSKRPGGSGGIGGSEPDASSTDGSFPDGSTGGGGRGGSSFGASGGSSSGGPVGGRGGDAGGGGAAATDGGAGGQGAGDAGACGETGQACCVGNTCGGGLDCLDGVTCSCAKALFGRYLLRADGKVLYQSDTAQVPVIDSGTGLPLEGIAAVADGVVHGCALQGGTKTVWCWRTTSVGNSLGQLGSGTIDTSGPTFRATKVLTAAGTPLANITVLGDVTDGFYGQASCAADDAGKLWCWGNLAWITNGGNELSSPYAVPVTTDGVTPLEGVTQVSLGGPGLNGGGLMYACAIVRGVSSAEVWCWGANNEGYLGTGDTDPRPYPTKVLGVNQPKKVVVFGSYGASCALDGTNVRCWGSNAIGETGIGMTGARVGAPALVTLMGGLTALGDVVDLATGDGDTICALRSTHSAVCWGGPPFQPYPTTYGVPNVVSLGGTDVNAIRVLTSDGQYHIGGTTRIPNCGPL